MKLKCLYGEFEEKKKLLLSKKSDTEKLITQLSQLAVQSQAVAAVKAASDKLNQFSAELFAGLDELQMKHNEKRIAIEQNKTMNIDLNLDMGRFDGPNLDMREIDTLKLLVSISLTSRPPQPPFAPRSPLGSLGPPPGLQASEAGASGVFRPNMPTVAARHQPPPPIQLPQPQRPAFGNAMAVGSPARQKAGGRMTPGSAPSPPAPAPAPGPVGADVESKRIRSTQRLICQLRQKLPNLTMEQADRYIQILRERNDGKLSALSVTGIMQGVQDLWVNDVGAAAAFGAVGQARHNPVVGGARHVPADIGNDNECIICFDEMDNRNSRQLTCNHRFHLSCIKVSFSVGTIIIIIIVIICISRSGWKLMPALATPAPSAGTSSLM